ncbi:cell division protein ZapA, partial [Escherichia coli]|nr:cell division protein ZapA [Escherichia coli]
MNLNNGFPIVSSSVVARSNTLDSANIEFIHHEQSSDRRRNTRQSYTSNCPAGQEESLVAAAKDLDRRLKEMSERTKV